MMQGGFGWTGLRTVDRAHVGVGKVRRLGVQQRTGGAVADLRARQMECSPLVLSIFEVQRCRVLDLMSGDNLIPL